MMSDSRNAAMTSAASTAAAAPERPKRKSPMTDYFLVILLVFGCIQFYFNVQQESSGGEHHQRDHIAAFQRKHFTISHSKSRIKAKAAATSETLVATAAGAAGEKKRGSTTRGASASADAKEQTDNNGQASAAAADGDAEEEEEDGKEEEDYREQDLDKHYLAGLSCERFGGPSDEDAAEMVFWEDIPSDSQHISPFQDPKRKQYLTFEADHGGWNNIRMAMETTMTLAVAMGRTLVLPPAQGMYLLAKGKSEHTGKEQAKDFSFADFFHMESIADEHVGMEVITMKEFLEREGLTGNLRDIKTGEVVLPPDNRTDYDGADHRAISKTLEAYLQRIGMVPPWDPEECLAAFPATKDPKDVQAIQKMFEDVKTFPPYTDFIGHPVPVNGTAIDRLKENRADRTQLCIYDEKLQDVQLIHFGEGAQGKGARLLVHFYAFLFFQDWKQDLWMKRFVRDHVRYIDEIQCAAARIVTELRARSRGKGDANGDYNAYHIRRGDFQYKDTRYEAPRIIKNSAKEMTMGGVVYIASDEKDQKFFEPFREIFDVVMLDDFKHLLVGVNTNYYGMIDSLIASRSKIFFGCWFSTFTGYINRIRGFHHNKRKGPGYEQGHHTSYYYALDDRKYHLQEFYPVKKSFYAREFPAAWRLIDEGIGELVETTTTTTNADGGSSVIL